MKSLDLVRSASSSVGSDGDSRRRQLAITRAEFECEAPGCGWVAWSHARADELQLRAHPTIPGKMRVLCPECTKRHDAREAKRAQRRIG